VIRLPRPTSQDHLHSHVKGVVTLDISHRDKYAMLEHQQRWLSRFIYMKPAFAKAQASRPSFTMRRRGRFMSIEKSIIDRP
jgi:hypothetical protein